MDTRTDGTIAVVGGGLAGLAAATYLARAGRRVTLLERASRVGGRAGSLRREGFVLNQGAHALYGGGAARRVLAELGIAWRGARVPGSGHVASQGRLHLLPAGPLSGIGSRAVGWAGKWQLGRMLSAVRRDDPDALASIPVSEWLDRHVTASDARALAEAIVRVATYGGEPETLSAAVAVAQIRSVLREGVYYLDGGWQTLVSGLAEAARDAGVALRTGARARRVVVEDGRARGVELEDGSRLDAGAVLIAAGPAVASALVADGAHPDLSRHASEAKPVRVATLDLGLRALPRPDRRLVLDLETPLYFAVHSATARLAPEGGARVHAMKYLGTGPSDAEADRAEIEALLDVAQPGWRDAVATQQWLPAMVVHHDLPEAARGGLAGRPDVAVPGIRGLYLAGDWVGPEGLLSDASLSSARRVAEVLVEGELCSRAA